jgi:uncharacterized protein YllA (UPF0747 family)
MRIAVNNPQPLLNLDSVDSVLSAISSKQYPESALTTALEGYNREIGNPKGVRHPGKYVVTGQQLGFMGGPLYTLLKAISAILIAKEMGATPLFWFATEDHDIHEIDHTYHVDEKGNLIRYKLNFPNRGYSVENLKLQAEHIEMMRDFAKVTGSPLPKVPEVGESYHQVMAQVVASKFMSTDLLFIEPYAIRHLYRDFIRREIIDRVEIGSLLRSAAEKRRAAGEEVILNFEGDTNLFYRDEQGIRKKVVVGDDEQLWLERAETSIDRFTVNAAARTIVQSMIIPTAVYVAGPTEMRYYSQLKEYHDYYNVPAPLLIPRVSATVVSKVAAEFLEHLGLQPWELTPDAAHAQGKEMHYLKNFLFPKQELQERVLGWWEFGDIIEQMVKTVDWRQRGHHYIWTE